MNELGNYIKELRGSHSIRRVADKAGVSHSYLTDIEKGYSRATGRSVQPSKEILNKISNVLAEINDNKINKHTISYNLFKYAGYINEFSEPFIRTTSHDLNLIINSPFNINEKLDDGEFIERNYEFPINDLSYHLNDSSLVQKYYEGFALENSDLYFFDTMMRKYLESKYSITIEDVQLLTNLVGYQKIMILKEVKNILIDVHIKFSDNEDFKENLRKKIIESNIITNEIDLDLAYEIAKKLV